MACLFTSRILPTPWGGHTTNSPAVRGVSSCLTPLLFWAPTLFAVFALAAEGLFFAADGRLEEVPAFALALVFVLAEDLDPDFGFVLALDLDLTLTFDLAGLLALVFAFVFALVAFFVVARRADVLDLLEAGRLDLAAFFAAGLLLLETRFLLVVFFFFSLVVPLIF
ncbi:MAG: hypothetical protein OXF19_00320 [Hyphomicrobiales bacterium]|nr:hypothetical protein [Hyphomicrobiales bacterium]